MTRQEQLQKLSTLADPLADFFDQVHVMCDDERMRQNRLRLLKCISDLIADFAHVDKIQDGV